MRHRLLTAAAGIALAAAGLGACSSSDSTVSGTPSAEIAPPPSNPTSKSSEAPEPGGGGFPESPATVPEDAPGLETPEVSARENAFLESLDKEGVDTEKLQLELIGAGNNICRIRATGGAADETTTLADAMAGQLVAGGYVEGEPAEVSQMLVDVSIAELCP